MWCWTLLPEAEARATRTGRAKALPFLFLFLLCSIGWGQTQVFLKDAEGFIQEKVKNPGESYTVELVLLNQGKKDVEILILQKDLILDRGRTLLKEVGVVERSNSSWFVIKNPRLLLKGQRKATLKIPVNVPMDVKPGSYHSLLIVSITPHRKEQGKVSMGIVPQYGLQIITTIPGGVDRAEVVECVEEKGMLNLDIRNTGENLLILRIRPDNDLIESRRVLIYPDQTQRTSLNCEGLQDGIHKERILLDNEKQYIKPVIIEFRKGEIPKQVTEAPLHHLEGESLRRRTKRKPVSLYAVVNYGDRNRGLSLAGNLRFGNLSLNAGSSFVEYPNDYDFSTYRLMANYRVGRFRIGAGSYLFGDRWQTAFRAGLNLKYTNFAVNYMKESKTLGVNISQRILKRFIINFMGYKNQYRESWNFSLMIPLL